MRINGDFQFDFISRHFALTGTPLLILGHLAIDYPHVLPSPAQDQHYIGPSSNPANQATISYSPWSSAPFQPPISKPVKSGGGPIIVP
ncbi:hypothetical protein PAAG_06930 [Paracoccidioides lutzii Pb01]|uniref:Uncharacterized protein n=1 Tax=Paracoccidioides lutzii (strain ATCC MYA-826 / Pb01) TaxID=502779 RepID=C1H8D4_PARBA|nr:hypothetical protein PAAG_06930 [Paracoccidioides lutzii Pb01]EEH36512.2 hypothetical protein PAAG_06930 [Paracoccidioides lutzii Pb01]